MKRTHLFLLTIRRAVSPILIAGYRLFIMSSLAILFTACANLPESASSTDAEQKASDNDQTMQKSEPSSNQPELSTPAKLKPPRKKPLHIIAVGDVMPGTDFPENHLPPDNGRHLLSGVAAILADADVTFGNFEGTLLYGGEPAKKCRNPKQCYVFRSPPTYVENLVQAGFDVMSLANNHARDFGEQGRTSSMSTLAAAGIRHSGREGDVARWQVDGVQMALIAFAPFRGSHDPLDISRASEIVQALKAENDLVMISMHMGAEGKQATRIPFKNEIFYGENRGDVVRFSHAMIDAGADLVLGHGPHVPRAIELYQGRLIAYSLGNFCTYYGINVRGMNGLAPILSVRLYPDGEFFSGQIISAEQIRPKGPTLDPQHRAARLIAKLTRLDFPQSPLEITPNGQIKVKVSEINMLDHRPDNTVRPHE